jgi:hypothetical protein
MSYNHQNIDYWLTAATGALLTGVVDPLVTGMTNFRPGYQPIMVDVIYAVIVTAPTVTASTAVFKYRPTIGSATGEVTIGTLTFPVATAIGTMVFKTVDNVKCPATGEIVVSITVASTAGAAAFGFMAAPNWDSPGNNLKMLRSA